MISELWYHPPSNKLFEVMGNFFCLNWDGGTVVRYDFFSKKELRQFGCVRIGVIEELKLMTGEEIEQALSEAVKLGWVEITQDIPEKYFKLTEKGRTHIEELLKSSGVDPEEIKKMSPQDFYERLGF